MNWGEFLRELSLLILLNRSNDDVIISQGRYATIPPHLANASVVLRPTVPYNDTDLPRKSTLTRSNTPATPMLPNVTCDESFLEYAKVLEKLNKKNRSEEIQRKQMGSNFTIVENLDEEDNINLPKLKPCARDDRRTITDPWTSVKEMQQLRNQPILIKTTRIRLLKT
jgi:hypothetical protein